MNNENIVLASKEVKDDCLVANIEPLSNSNIREVIESTEFKFSLAPRGLGRMENGIVQPGFTLISVDIVSHNDASRKAMESKAHQHLVPVEEVRPGSYQLRQSYLDDLRSCMMEINSNENGKEGECNG